MHVDFELYRKRVRVADSPPLHLSVIDIAPDSPRSTIVFIHGFGGRSLQWKYQLEEFSVQNRVIAFDLRGHGHSDKPHGEYLMEEIVADLGAALDRLGVKERITIVGHSFGGAVVTEFTHRFPDRVDRMVLIASSGEYKLDRLRYLGLRLPYRLQKLIEPFTLKWLYAPFHVLRPWLTNTLAVWNGWSMFRDITVPTLVLRGHFDRIFSTHAFEEVARVLPNAEEVNVGASGHMVMLERREATNRAIKRFTAPTPRSWRDDAASSQESARVELIRERPWLKHYEESVPYTVAIPEVPIQQFLESASRRFAHRQALYFEGRKLSYRQLFQECNRFARALADQGIRPGDRIVLLLPNIPQMVIAFYGVLLAGAVPVLTQPLTAPDELARQVRESGARMLVTVNQHEPTARTVWGLTGPQSGGPLEFLIFAQARAYLPAWKRLLISLDAEKRNAGLLTGGLQAGMYSFEELTGPQGTESLHLEVQPRDLAVIIFTGGTTAAPKGVMLSHRNLVANTLQTRHWLPDAREGKERFLSVIPFSHSYGLTTALTIPIALGATMILKAQFKIEEILEVIRSQKPTLFPGVPQMYVAISNFPGVRRYNVRSIKACISGSDPLSVETQESFEKLTRGRLVEGYGLTEASPVTHANPFNGLRKVGSIGIPIPSTEARILDLRRRNREMPAGQIGELAVRGPQVMMGYWGLPEATEKVLTSDGWLLTGDVAQMDSDGYFRIIARKADMWYPARPGQPAFPRDVEEILYEVPQVKEAAVVAIAGKPIAFVIADRTRPKATELIAYCKRRLPPELVPILVIFVDEFPRSFIGKILRRELARHYEQQRSADLEAL